jgi:hypothetical protein
MLIHGVCPRYLSLDFFKNLQSMARTLVATGSIELSIGVNERIKEELWCRMIHGIRNSLYTFRNCGYR